MVRDVVVEVFFIQEKNYRLTIMKKGAIVVTNAMINSRQVGFKIDFFSL